MDHATFFLKPTPPFRLDLTAWVLRRRPANVMDRWDGKAYQRVLVVEGKPAEITVTQAGSPNTPKIRISVAADRLTRSAGISAKKIVAASLGAGIDLADFYKCAATDKRLNSLAQRFVGAKPTRFPTVFEALINGIACQQLSLSAGIQLLNRLAQTYGLAFDGAKPVTHAFPRPEDLISSTPERLRELGFNRQKALAIIGLSQALTEGRLDLDELEHKDDQEAIARLCEWHGVGRWTAEFVLLRGLGRLHIFPGDDVGARGALGRWLRLRKPLDYARVRAILARWQPYSGFVYFHMLMNGLAKNGLLN